MPRIIHFEFCVQEPERAVEFCEKVFAWKVQKWGGPQTYWLVTTGPDSEPGINDGIVRRQEGFPGTINAIGACPLWTSLWRESRATAARS
jgi:hypothetical protein